MDMKLLRQLNRWHDTDEHQKIADALEALPKERLDYEAACYLARAYNNLERYEDAIELLFSVETQGGEDPLWYFRLGYAHYYLDREDEAKAYFQEALERDPDDEDSKYFIEQCDQYLEAKGQPLEYDPVVYSPEEAEVLEAHIAEHFGEFPTVFHELVSPDIHVDIAVVEPTEERNYYTLITMGMGAQPMNIPEELRAEGLARAEMVVCLPPDWEVQSSEERYYWPLRWLKILARLPSEEDSWLGWGHTVPNGGPFAEDTGLSGVILFDPDVFDEEAWRCSLPSGETVNFYQVYPIYEEEMQFKLNNSAEALLEFMDEVSPVVDIHRPNTCAFLSRKQFAKTSDEIYTLLKDWDGPAGCLATDRILVDGCKVGYMYREQPDDKSDMPDSGWRFTAGDESDEYMDNPEHSGIYALNTICNYDPDILPLLTAPYGTAFYRDENGAFQQEEFVPGDED